MRFARIVMLDFEERDFAPEEWRELADLAHELDRCKSSDPELLQRLGGADCLLVQLGVALTAERLAAAPELRYVGVFGTSTGRIGALPPGVVLRNVPGFSTEAVAEFAVGVVLEHLRGLAAARARAALGDFSEPVHPGAELRGRRWAVLGLGAIGRRVAEIAGHGFGARVRTWSRTPQPELGFQHRELEALLPDAEILSVHVALTAETRGLLDAGHIARMAEGALLLHLAPPELLDMTALLRRVQARELHFVTDHADEMDPRVVAALAESEACTLYPPIGYATREARAARRARFLGDLRAFVDSAR